jgi:peptidoglycan/xylan/chitin deacetylase (PgdA/CDA1 family)
VKYSSYLRDDKLAIFLFHGVVKKSAFRVRNYNRKHIESSYFDDILKDLGAHGIAISLDDFLDYRSGKRELPSRSFVVTFDDGFENNFSEAAPILRKHSIPAIFYVTTSFIDENKMSWIDQIELCLERISPLQLSMPWCAKPYELASVEQQINFLNDIRSRGKSNKNFIPSEIVATIYDQCDKGAITSSDDPVDRKMNWDQVEELAKDPLFTVGGHSHTHVILSGLDDRGLALEIDESIEMLRARTGNSNVNHFSYPKGFQGSYTQETIDALVSCGVVSSMSTLEGVNDLHTPLFHLRRITVV